MPPAAAAAGAAAADPAAAPLSLSARRVSHRIAGAGFAISRGSKTHADVVQVHLRVAAARGSPAARGRGECVPYARYGESAGSVVDAIERGIAPALAAAAEGWAAHEPPEARAARLAALRVSLLREAPAGATRNAVDCALWDCECKLLGIRIWEHAEVDAALSGPGSPPPAGWLDSCVTVSIDTEARMRESAAARAAAGARWLKVKVGASGGDADIARVRAVREAAGAGARLVVDSNEGMEPGALSGLTEAMHGLGVAVLEQPLPADADGALLGFRSPVPLCADESMHTSASLDDGRARLLEKYQVLNIKLDKTGGLTEALRTYARIRERNAAARARGEPAVGVMAGCMVCSSLGIAPMLATVARVADFVDLDGGALLEEDVPGGVEYAGGGGRANAAFSADLWG